MGLWSLLFGWGKRADAAHEPVPAPKMARRRRKTAKLVESGASRQCRFERMEERQMLDADPIRLGAVYIEQDGGGPRNRRQGVADLFDPQPYFRNFSSTLFSWQMNSIRSSSAARRQFTRTVQGLV